MPRFALGTMLSMFMVYLAVLPQAALADCVSCGTGGACFTASPGFSANCECRIRSVNGVVTCKPSGICDPNDATSCDGGFPSNLAAHSQIATRFLDKLAQRNPLLAGAVWGGIVEANSSPNPSEAETKGTMGREGRSYSYQTRVRRLADGSASLVVHVQEDGAKQGEDYEGTVTGDGRVGRFLQVGPQGKALIFSWDNH
jgi:hypothetical protein